MSALRPDDVNEGKREQRVVGKSTPVGPDGDAGHCHVERACQVEAPRH